MDGHPAAQPRTALTAPHNPHSPAAQRQSPTAAAGGGPTRGRSRYSVPAPSPANYLTQRNNSDFQIGTPHFKWCARERYNASLACSPADE